MPTDEIEDPKGKTIHEESFYKTEYPGLIDREVKFLMKLDKDTEKHFEIQMRKRNKNDEMVRNKINDLNEKPALRDFIFKQVSDQQLEKDIVEEEFQIEKLYAM